jgi:membrane associated rhomboid family serine protease
MIIPLKDNVPTHTVPIITVSLILVNIFIYVWNSMFSLSTMDDIIARYAFVPHEMSIALTTRPDLIPYNILTIFTSMFLHGGVLHTGGNMLYLWIFGNNVEDMIGKGRYIVFYLLSGMAAGVTQFSIDTVSPIPLIGASGAVSGILGAYLILFPYAKVKTLLFLFIFFTTFEVPAVVLLSGWFIMQIVFSNGPGVAWFAHIGGFVFGLVAIYLFRIGRKRKRTKLA